MIGSSSGLPTREQIVARLLPLLQQQVTNPVVITPSAPVDVTNHAAAEATAAAVSESNGESASTSASASAVASLIEQMLADAYAHSSEVCFRCHISIGWDAI